MKSPSLPLWLELAAAICIALLASNLATVAFFELGGEQRFKRFSHSMQSERVAETASLVLSASEPLRHELPQALSSPGIHLTLDKAPLVSDSMSRAQSMEASISRLLPGTEIRAHNVSDAERDTFRPSPPLPPPLTPAKGKHTAEPPRSKEVRPMGPPEMIASIKTADGKWINMQLGSVVRTPPFEQWPFLYALGTTVVALLLAAIFMGRRVARPLHILAEAARGLRRGDAGPPVPERGPAPVREAAQAFNAMSERVSTTLKSQQAMMAAVAHDLRTPIAVLRVRAEFVSDDDTRNRLLETIGEMQQMTEAVLSAMRIDGSGEPSQSVDMGSLAESLCADMEELGRDVRYLGGPQTACRCRATEIRRALGNLIDNAVRYGNLAQVSFDVRDGMLAIHVDDEGPGIPPDQIARVFEPFARLEESRSSDTGGHGLGLAIARLIARGHGGEVTLANRQPRGLRATLSLPLS